VVVVRGNEEVLNTPAPCVRVVKSGNGSLMRQEPEGSDPSPGSDSRT
jgi:hypothetical protein